MGKRPSKQLTKCDFCKYWGPRGCWGIENSYYCREATEEFFAYLRNLKTNNNKKPYRR